MRGSLRCGEIDAGWSPFIGAEGYRGCCGKSTMARALRRRREVDEGGVLFCGSWRFSGRRRLG
jgi:ABC-type glutathione transport system ATPase component